ncbi:hypothetical protein BGLA2_2640002 [Burkholderia gladioli]|nr:hypothetical protein BGLA2_2640002 [Burkholderia gladioli]
MLVDHLEVHEQVGGQCFQLEIRGFHGDLRLVADIADQHVEQRAGAEALAARALDETGRELGQRHAVAAQLLRQRLQQQLHLLLEHARHQPLGAARVHLVQGVERHLQGHAVARRAGLEVIAQAHLDASHGQSLREQVGGHASRLVAHQVVARQVQQAQLVLSLAALPYLVAIPALERRAGVDAFGDRLVVEAVDQLVVDQHVLAARLVLELLDIGQQLAVVGEEGELRIEFAVHQRAADEQLARAPRILPAERHAAAVVDDQAIQRAALVGAHLGRLLLPVRLRERGLEQVRADLLDPFRLDPRQAARIEPAGLHQLGGHHPAPGLLDQGRARPQMELDAARAQVMRLVVGLHADIAEQAREQGQVNLLEGRLDLVQAPAVLAHHRQQLAVDVAPLAQPQVREEVGAAGVHQLPVRLLVRHRLLEPAPDPQPLQEFGALVGELAVRLVGLLLGLDRPVARVLHRQRAGDDQHLAQRLLVARGQDHAAHPRIERQPRQLAAERSQRVVVVDRAELVEQLVAVGDRAARRRLDEREGLDRAQVQRLHAQDHGRQRGTQDFRIGEARTRQVIGFLVEADADAVGHAAATAGTLVGGRLRDRLHLELLDLVAIGIALDTRQPRVDHVADARHGQRGFGHVGGQHDAARVRGLEHAFLVARREPREQRQDLGMRRMVLAQRLGRLADLALAGQEHQHVAGALAAQLVDRVDDAVHQVALGLARALLAVAPGGGALGVANRGRAIVGDRPVTHLDRVQAAADLEHWRRLLLAAEMARETLGVDGRRGHDQLQVGAPGQDLLQVAEQEIDVEAALVRLVDDQRVIGAQQRIGLRLGQQDAVRHQLDRGAGREIVGKTYLVADHLAERRAELLGDAAAGGRGGQPARLGVADEALAASAEPAAELETDLRQLGGLARTGLAADDHHLVGGDRARDLLALARDGQAFGEADRRDRVRRYGRPRGARLAGFTRLALFARGTGFAALGPGARFAAPGIVLALATLAGFARRLAFARTPAASRAGAFAARLAGASLALLARRARRPLGLCLARADVVSGGGRRRGRGLRRTTRRLRLRRGGRGGRRRLRAFAGLRIRVLRCGAFGYIRHGGAL